MYDISASGGSPAGRRHHAVLPGVAVRALRTAQGRSRGTRRALQRELEAHGLEALHDRLARVDPLAAQRIHRTIRNAPCARSRSLGAHQRAPGQLQATAGQPMPFRAISLCVRRSQRATASADRQALSGHASKTASWKRSRRLVARGDLHGYAGNALIGLSPGLGMAARNFRATKWSNARRRPSGWRSARSPGCAASRPATGWTGQPMASRRAH